MDKSNLAVYQYKDIIIESIEKNQAVVIEAPTGSGKTTQIPQIIFEAGLDKWGVIGVTQPRRIAAFGVSSRIAYEMGVELGQLVGYKMRFDDTTSAQTKIKIMTDGILLEELRTDPMLMKYSIIVVDEAHERSLNIDFILGLLKQILLKRSDFKVIISSATINAKLFSKYFNGAPIISVETKPFPVKEKYYRLKNNQDFNEQLEVIKTIIIRLENNKQAGDVLIFFPGEGAIKECCAMLESIDSYGRFKVLPLYSRLSLEEQNLVFKAFPGKRKIVVATNIAETSITIDGIVFVIDPGYAKINYYNSRTFTSFLELRAISKASCDQRRGRAGRTAPGIVHRLYSRDDYLTRELYTKEEIYRTDLSEVVLRMADLGINNYHSFEFISSPTRGGISSAIDTLISIGAFDEIHQLTSLGKAMVDFPLAPRHSRIVLESINKYPEVLNEVIIVISFLSAKNPFLYPRGEETESQVAHKKLLERGGDFFTWLNVFYKFESAKDKEGFCKQNYLDVRVLGEIANIHDQITSMCEQRGIKIGYKKNRDKLLLCICAGLKQFICMREPRRKNSFKSLTEFGIRVHPGSFLYHENPDWLVGGEIINTGRTYLRSGAILSEKLIKSHMNGLYREITGVDKAKKRKEQVKKYASMRTEIKTPVKGPVERFMLFDKYFDFQRDHGETIADVPYQVLMQLAERKQELLEMDFGDKVARLVYKDVFILKDSFANLVAYFDKIDLEKGFNKEAPLDLAFVYPNDWVSMYRWFFKLMKPTLKPYNKLASGFLILSKINDDVFQFDLEDDYYVALESNIFMIRELFEHPIPAWNEKEKAEINEILMGWTAIIDEIDD